MKIAVAGATGRVGTHVVAVAEQRGHEVVRMSRATGVDVITEAGLAAALAGVDCIIDVATQSSPDQDAAIEFFTTATRNLHAAGTAAGVRRMVVVSIIGVDKLSAGYSLGVQAHEREALAGPIPVRIVRAAQFFEFFGDLLSWGRRGDVVYVPEMRIQPVASRAVAEVLVDAAEGDGVSTAGDPDSIAEVAGPTEERLLDLARVWVGREAPGLTVELQDTTGWPDSEANAGGGLLPGPGAILAGPTFAEWFESSRQAV
jgi:uncharacterized protein YbjT (DUF2867 family)